MRQGLDDDEHPVALFRSSFRGSNDFVIQISAHRYGSERLGRVSIERFERKLEIGFDPRPSVRLTFVNLTRDYRFPDLNESRD